MSKTILITGASSGIGKETALYFARKGWNVAATMRNTEQQDVLRNTSGINLYRLDVQDQESIDRTIEQVENNFSQIDVLLNNAGYGAKGPFEYATEKQIQQQFDVNVFGLMRVTKAVLPHMRKANAGTIINVSSIAGLITFPLYSLYNSSKWAVEGFTEALQYELDEFNIRLKLIEPGAIQTDFDNRSLVNLQSTDNSDYESFITHFQEVSASFTANAPGPKIVAEIIYKAANDRSNRLRYLVGKDARQLAFGRRWFGYRMFMKQVRKMIRKK
jgi:short-subunit dehydrogenase